ncbi:hypothetical protein [Pseudomonas zeae]|jgi:hypothetical protein|uniref:hypothetical protein n=1 Tax=Pseudomonas zeae TaxID=2745510 RepID=UPI0039E17E93
MALDWNWFFSSLSQSAAAIVGIFGAFIITKIFSNQTVFRDKNTKLKDLLVQARKISDVANSHNIEWYNEQYNKYEFDDFLILLEESHRGEESLDKITEEVLNEFIDQKQFSPYSDSKDVRRSLTEIAHKFCSDNVKKREERQAEAEAYARSQKSDVPKRNIFGMPAGIGAGYISMPQSHSLDYISRTPIPWEDMKKISSGFKQSFLETKHHCRLVTEFLESIDGDPESPKQISYALALVLCIFFIGVIYPLSFLPANGEPNLGFSIAILSYNIFSFKGYLLGIVSLAFSIIVALFFNTHTHMKYPQGDVDKIKSFRSPVNYCSDFKVFIG